MQNKTFTVLGMICEGCANKIKKSVGQLEGAEVVQVNLTIGQIEVSYDETQASLEEVKETINQQGYLIVEDGNVVNQERPSTSCCKSR